MQVDDRWPSPASITWTCRRVRPDEAALGAGGADHPLVLLAQPFRVRRDAPSRSFGCHRDPSGERLAGTPAPRSVAPPASRLVRTSNCPSPRAPVGHFGVGSSEFTGYCSYTKAIEHLGDRWSLLIVRELGMFGPQGFNDLALGLPGRISRSVLADRLRRLETLGLVSRRDGQDPHQAYHLTSVGQGLMRTLGSLRAWADTWLPDDPDMLERDPDVVLGWLAQRADPDRSPERPVVLELRLTTAVTGGTGSCSSAGASRVRVPHRPVAGRQPLRLPRVLPVSAPGDCQRQDQLVGRLQGWIRPGRWRPRPAPPRANLVRVRPGPGTHVAAG